MIDTEGFNPLTRACQLLKADVVLSLIRSGFDVNKPDKYLYANKIVTRSPLSVAVDSLSEDIVSILINHGAFVKKSPREYLGPLHIACFKGNHNIIKLLVNSGANVNERTGGGQTPLFISILFGHNPQVSNFLIKSGSKWE